MRTAQNKHTAQTRSHRPRAITVFAAAFVAGAAAAVGVNRTLDVRLAQSKPRVESEAIFVALRSLPQGAPVTVWDVALRDWPKAMMPASALRASDTFSGHVLKHPLREGQPLLSIQLAPAGREAQPAAEPTPFPPPPAYTKASTPSMPCGAGDIWAPAEPVMAQGHPRAQQPTPPVTVPVTLPVAVPVMAQPEEATPPTTSVAAAPLGTPMHEQTVEESTLVEAAEPTAPIASSPTETAEAEAMVADTPASVDETVSASDTTTGTVPQPPAQPATEPASTATVAAPPVPASEPTPAPTAASDIPEPVVAIPSTPASPTPIDMPPPAPAVSVDRPRPMHSRYLVVPESIAVQADASFTARPAAPQQPAASSPPAVPQTASRSAANAVRPLPSTTTVDRGPQSKSQSGPQGRAPQRQGRQGQPDGRGTPANTTPPPRLGATMFPTLSAGIGAIESRIRGDQPAQGQAPQAAQPQPLTVR